ncbi:MAG: cytidine deaminase [Heliobacteriaceae bacterium]|jgi:cytidine deaminase|nr:cytidine deaminase [Heliobacteriaceae bacterium]
MEYDLLMQKAKEASQKAYCPYSDFPVGACVLAESGKTYCGCNVENASFGLTVCAERNAVFAAIAAGERKIIAVAIYSPKLDDCVPCGACRQVFAEFGGDMDIITETKSYKLSELLPARFGGKWG